MVGQETGLSTLIHKKLCIMHDISKHLNLKSVYKKLCIMHDISKKKLCIMHDYILCIMGDITINTKYKYICLSVRTNHTIKLTRFARQL